MELKIFIRKCAINRYLQFIGLVLRAKTWNFRDYFHLRGDINRGEEVTSLGYEDLLK